MGRTLRRCPRPRSPGDRLQPGPATRAAAGGRAALSAPRCGHFARHTRTHRAPHARPVEMLRAMGMSFGNSRALGLKALDPLRSFLESFGRIVSLTGAALLWLIR